MLKFHDVFTCHGWRYAMDASLHPTARVAWALAMLASLSATVYFVAATLGDWSGRPIVNVIEDYGHPIEVKILSGNVDGSFEIGRMVGNPKVWSVRFHSALKKSKKSRF